MTHPIVNPIKTEWGYLGKRRKIFIFYMSLFVIAGVVSLLTPYIIGTIFNSIQESITSKEELVVLSTACFHIRMLRKNRHGLSRQDCHHRPYYTVHASVA